MRRRNGYDLFLQDIGDRYLVSIGSVEAANKILEASCNPREATDEDRIAFRQVTRHRQESFNPDIPDIQEIPMLMDAFHSDPFWEELGSRCLSCTACSSVCPTCCFDICDVLDPDGKTGKRDRVWDRMHESAVRRGLAGGHNPPTGADAFATACITSSTVFSPRTTATSALVAAGAFTRARRTSRRLRCSSSSSERERKESCLQPHRSTSFLFTKQVR